MWCPMDNNFLKIYQIKIYELKLNKMIYLNNKKKNWKLF